MVAQRADGVAVQVELGHSRTGGEAAVREGGDEVEAQAQNAEGGEERGGAGGHLRKLTEAWVKQQQSQGLGSRAPAGLTWFPVSSTSWIWGKGWKEAQARLENRLLANTKTCNEEFGPGSEPGRSEPCPAGPRCPAYLGGRVQSWGDVTEPGPRAVLPGPVVFVSVALATGQGRNHGDCGEEDHEEELHPEGLGQLSQCEAEARLEPPGRRGRSLTDSC